MEQPLKIFDNDSNKQTGDCWFQDKRLNKLIIKNETTFCFNYGPVHCFEFLAGPITYQSIKNLKVQNKSIKYRMKSVDQPTDRKQKHPTKT